MGRLDGKIAVVTGGANGIGRACCERFAEEGADVVVADLGADAGAETVALVEKQGRKALYVHVRRGERERQRRAHAARGGCIRRHRLLVTAAGITHAAYESGNVERELEMFGGLGDLLLDPARMFSEMPLEHWHKVLDVNLTGTYLALRAVVEPMRDAWRRGDRHDRVDRSQATGSRACRLRRFQGRRVDADQAGRAPPSPVSVSA